MAFYSMHDSERSTHVSVGWDYRDCALCSDSVCKMYAMTGTLMEISLLHVPHTHMFISEHRDQINTLPLSPAPVPAAPY